MARGRATTTILGHAAACVASLALVIGAASPAAAKRRIAKAAPPAAAALFRLPRTDGFATAGRTAAWRPDARALVGHDLDDPFLGDADDRPATAGLTLAPGWTAAATVYGAARADRSRAPLDRGTDGFSSRLTRAFGSGTSLSGSVESDPRVMTTTIEAKQEFRAPLRHGRAIVSAFEVGWARESAVGHGFQAAFASADAPPTARRGVSLTRDAAWINSKTSVAIAAGLSLTAEFEAEANSNGHMLLGYFGLKQSW